MKILSIILFMLFAFIGFSQEKGYKQPKLSYYVIQVNDEVKYAFEPDLDDAQYAPYLQKEKKNDSYDSYEGLLLDTLYKLIDTKLRNSFNIFLDGSIETDDTTQYGYPEVSPKKASKKEYKGESFLKIFINISTDMDAISESNFDADRSINTITPKVFLTYQLVNKEGDKLTKETVSVSSGTPIRGQTTDLKIGSKRNLTKKGIRVNPRVRKTEIIYLVMKAFDEVLAKTKE